LMARCTGIKRDGGRCTATVEPPQTYCWWHDPANADKRRRAASRGGRGGGNREIRDLKHRISEVIDDVLEGSQDRGRAAVAIQGFNALRGVLELERKLRELDELEARIEALERSAGEQRGGRSWGA
jgi:hypothetical protein